MAKYAVAWKTEMDPLRLEFVYADSQYAAAMAILKSEDEDESWLKAKDYVGLQEELWDKTGWEIIAEKATDLKVRVEPPSTQVIGFR